MNKGLLFLAVGSIIVAAISFIKLSQQRKNKALANKQNKYKSQKKILQPQPETHTPPQKQVQHVEENNGDNSIVVEKSQFGDNQPERDLYQNDIVEQHPYKTILNKPVLDPDIKQLHYSVLLSLNKSKGYQGVIKIKIASQNRLDNKDIHIDAIASTILYLSVNQQVIEPTDIIFKNHQLLIKKQWLPQKQNNIQIIFANKYAFMGDGLTCYFPLDQFNKYSLKGQVIYVRNGFYKVARIFPCLNLLNPCDVSLQVLHPNGFSTESNNHKIQMKIATKKDYPQYQFLFYANNKALNNSYRLNNSVLTQSNSFRSNDQIIKAKSQFSLAKLSTIHDFFLFSSAIVQVRPNTNLLISSSASNDTVLKDILIRYFTKQHLVKKASSFLSILQSQIVQIFQKINLYKKSHKNLFKYHCKMDIFFIDDLKAQGDFYSGSILLNESTIQRSMIDRRLYFLLCRAFIGMGMLMKKNQSLLLLDGLFKLNQVTLDIFEDCVDFIYVKNKEYENIRKQCIRILNIKHNNQKTNKIFFSEDQQEEADLQYWLSQYYQKQCRYFVKNLQKYYPKVSINVRNILEALEKLSPDQYWTFFIARFPFIQFNVAQVLIKISVKTKGRPTGQAEMKYAKQNFIKSKYYIKFFTHQQIQADLKRFIQLKTHGIQKILPFIKIKQSFLASIPQNLQGYLYAKQNRLDSKKLYDQFKKYNQNNNFHHISALRRQIKRIRLLARDNIQEQRKDIQCGLMGWKLLQKLKIYPLDQDTYRLIKRLEGIKGKKQKNITQQSEQAEQQAKKLQNLLEDSKQK